LTPLQETEAREAAAWQAFVAELGRRLVAHWPGMAERLGERADAFVEAAVQQALQRGMTLAAGVARYANLWFVWGPAFHDKPGFEWAQGILAAPKEREWVIVHQLVLRSLAELERRPGTRVEPRALAAVDAALMDRYARHGRRGALQPAEPPALPRAACDLEAAELKLLEGGAPAAYRFDGGDWQRAPTTAPPPLRCDAARPLPSRLSVLSPRQGQGAPAVLQARLRAHAVCNGDVHPAIGFFGSFGRWNWLGHETRAVSWPLATREQPLPRAGVGAVVGEETSPEPYPLKLESCGLRDEGDPLGELQTTLSVWPAEQWWAELQRAQPSAQPLLPGPRGWTRAATRCRLERDGASHDTAPFRLAFEEGLDADVAVGLQTLAAAWEQVPGLSAHGLEAMLGLLVGRAALTWGWAYGPGGLDGAPLMRLLAALELEACKAELRFSGEFALAGTRTRFTLRAAGSAPLRASLQRERADPPLAELMAGASAAWRFPFELALEPIAGDSGALLQAVGPVSGALVGAAGLRGCTSGSSGWEWFARLAVEPVAVKLAVDDPLLGRTTQEQPLLPALDLVNWSPR
jgi:hypothetical protein